MRIYFLLITTAIILSFSTAYFAINLQNSNKATDRDIAYINALKKEFEKETTPIAEIDFSALYPSRDSIQLIQPVTFALRPGNYSRPCLSLQEKMSKQYYDKSDIWEDFRCKKITKLPARFFEAAPVMSESGVSFAMLAFLSGHELYSTPDWVRANLNYFHLNELKDLPPAGLDGNYKILSRLEKTDLPFLASGRSNFLTKDFYLSRADLRGELIYKFFPRELFENYFKSKNLFLREKADGEKCYYEEAGLCFEKDSTQFLELFKKSSMLIFFISMLVLFLVALVLYRMIRQQKAEEERKKHALRVLTHELRTPIANLLLQVEAINKSNGELSPSLQDDFLKIEAEVYRLKRLAEKSRSYLEVHEGPGLIARKKSEVPSVNELIGELISPYKNVQFIPALNDSKISIDVYWLNMCFKNLVENALVHGKAPVIVTLENDENEIKLTVSNRGHFPYASIADVIKRPAESTTGLGLGLGIVSVIMKDLDGRLLLSKNSADETAFTLVFRK